MLNCECIDWNRDWYMSSPVYSGLFSSEVSSPAPFRPGLFPMDNPRTILGEAIALMVIEEAVGLISRSNS